MVVNERRTCVLDSSIKVNFVKFLCLSILSSLTCLLNNQDKTYILTNIDVAVSVSIIMSYLPAQ